MEGHREQLAPAGQRAVDQAARHAQVVGGQVGAAVVARHAEFEFLAFAQKQETAFRARYRQRRVHQRRKNVGRGEGGLQRTCQFHDRAQTGKLAAGRGSEPFGDPLHGGAISGDTRLTVLLFVMEQDLCAGGAQPPCPGLGGEDQAVGIGDAEFDAIGGSEFPPPDTVAVNEDSVAAIQIFDEVVAAFGQDARMRAGDSGVPQDQVAAGLSSDREGQRIERHAAARAGGLDNQQRGREEIPGQSIPFGHQVSGPRLTGSARHSVQYPPSSVRAVRT